MADRSKDIERIKALRELNRREEKARLERKRRRIIALIKLACILLAVIVVLIVGSIIVKKVSNYIKSRPKAATETDANKNNKEKKTEDKNASDEGNDSSDASDDEGSNDNSDGSSDGSSENAAAAEENADGSTTIKMNFVGDCMIASLHGKMTEGSLNWYADNYPTSYFFEKVIDYFKADDFTIANCENVFTDRDLPEREKNWSPVYWFKSKSKNANVFADNSIEAVTIANNHLLDYNEEGAEDTKAALDAAGVPWGLDDKIVYLEKNGFKIALVCIQFYDLNEARDTYKYLDTAKENSDFQIVFFHGGKEAVYSAEKWKQTACHELVDRGADLVIGAHPHVLQKIENYNGVDIAYSLGNFCFGGNTAPKNRTIIYQYELTVKDGAVIDKKSNVVPCYVYTGSSNNWQPAPITDQKKIDKVLKFLDGKTSNPN